MCAHTIPGRGFTCIMFQILKEQKSGNVVDNVSNHPRKKKKVEDINAYELYEFK